MRLFHPVVLDVVTAALGRSARDLEKKSEDRERKRLAKLPDQMVRAGASTRMAQDAAYVLRFDQFLLDHFPDEQRLPRIVRAAMERMDAEKGATRG